MDPEAEEDGEEIPAELPELLRQITLLDELLRHEEADADGGEVYDPGGDLHHHDAHALEEPQQRLPVLSTRGDSNALKHI